jgi:hypothetical protein
MTSIAIQAPKPRMMMPFASAAPARQRRPPIDDVEAEHIHERVAEHVDRVSHQGRRTRDDTCTELDEEHRCIDREHDLQHTRLLVAQLRYFVGFALTAIVHRLLLQGFHWQVLTSGSTWICTLDALKCHVPRTMHDTTTIGRLHDPLQRSAVLGIVAIHVLLGSAAVVAGLVAMLSVKAPGRHPRAGTWYFWLLASLFVTTTALSVMRWAHAYHLFVIGAFALAAAIVGREARRRRVRGWLRLHIAGWDLRTYSCSSPSTSTTASNCRRSATCRRGPTGPCRSRSAYR